jgi:hypothetical protein
MRLPSGFFSFTVKYKTGAEYLNGNPIALTFIKKKKKKKQSIK